eukprot:g3301.t1
MAHSSQGSLAAAAKAFAQTLRQQGALEELMNARPTAMREMPAERNEMEIFTCEEIIQNGRVAPGMAAVVRSSSGGIGGHVFIYEHRSIKDWQAQCSSDPCTRDPLSAHEIIPIS